MTPRRLVSTPWLVVAVVLVAYLVVVVALGQWTWDDGYITLAFARTFAETGHIGLTPVSETVEGATSPVWFLLMSAVYKLGVHSPFWFHFASQVLAACCAVGAAALLYMLIKPSAPKTAGWISVLALLLAPFRVESANGMEMNLLCLLTLGVMVSLSRRGTPGLAIASLTALVPWVRLEAGGYFLVAATAIWFFSRRRRAAVLLAASTIVSMLVLTVVRYLVFGTVLLTNTMLAKEMMPYTIEVGAPAWWSPRLVITILEPIACAAPAFVVAYALSRLHGGRIREVAGWAIVKLRSKSLPTPICFGCAYYVAYAGVEIVLGNNIFCPPLRMASSALLALVAATVLACSGTFEGREDFAAQTARRVATRRAPAAVIVLFLVPCIGIFAMDTQMAWVKYSDSDTKGGSGFSSKEFAENGEAIDRIRQLLGRQSIKVAMVDIGATGLYEEHLDILDLGLLANKEMTTMGWERLGEYLAATKPEVIQTNGIWSVSSGIYELAEFTQNYHPVVSGESFMYLRKDVLDQLRDRCVDADVNGKYFYSAYEGPSIKKGVSSQQQENIDKRYYRDTLGLRALCRLA